MGNWNINIQGVGSHHNKDNPADADKMAAEFAKKLVDAGHTVESTTFTSGSKTDLPRSIPPGGPAVRDFTPIPILMSGNK